MLRELIIKIRKAMQLSQTALAERIDVKVATLSDYENGKSSISADVLERIFEVLKIKIHTSSCYKQQWDEANAIAMFLLEKGISPDELTKKEMFDLTQAEIILALQEISESNSQSMDERDTFNNFKALVVMFHNTYKGCIAS